MTSEEVLGEDLEVSLEASGLVLAHVSHQLRATCVSDARNYPFDASACDLRLSPAARTAATLDLHAVGAGSVLRHYSPLPGWRMVDAWVGRYERHDQGVLLGDRRYAALCLHMRLTREGLYYILNLALPCLVAVVVALVALFAPGYGANMQGRAQVGLTAILYCAIQLLTIGEDMPVTAQYVPSMCRYFVTMILIVGLSSICHSFLLQLVKRHLLTKEEEAHQTKEIKSNKVSTLSASKGKDAGNDDDKEEQTDHYSHVPGPNPSSLKRSMEKISSLAYEYHCEVNWGLMAITTISAVINFIVFSCEH